MTEVSGKLAVLAMVVKPGIRPVGGEPSPLSGLTGSRVETDSKMERPEELCPRFHQVVQVRACGDDPENCGTRVDDHGKVQEGFK